MRSVAGAAWRSRAAVACLAAAVGYSLYAAATYGGAYAWLATAQLDLFGAYDPGLTFIVLALLLSVPACALAPNLRVPVAAAHGRQSDESRRRTHQIVLICVAVLLSIGIGEGALTFWRSEQRPRVGDVDLARPSQDISGYDQLRVAGVSQERYAVVVVHRWRSTTSRDLYTPLTSPSWLPALPIRVVLRESLPVDSLSDDRSHAAGVTAVQFGAVLHESLPGIARSAFEQSGLKLDPAFIILDPNVESSYFFGALVSSLAIIMALSLGCVHFMVSRQQGSRSMPAKMRTAPRRWHLRLGDQELAELFFESFETPWITVRIQPSQAFDLYRPYFTDPDAWREDDPAMDALLMDVKRHGGFILQPDGAAPTASFTLSNVPQRISKDPEFAQLRY